MTPVPAPFPPLAASDERPRIKVCLVAHFAFGALTGGTAGHIGGVERQTTLMARWLAARGHAVTLVTWDEGQAEGVVIDGVRVLKMCRRADGLPGLRFFHPRWTSLDRALARADAEVYYHNCGEYVTGQVALWARRHHRRFVYSVASDPECDPRLPQMKAWRERVLFRYGLAHAARIIVQTETQQRMLEDGRRLNSVVLPMPVLAPAGPFVPPSPPLGDGARVLWVGRLSPEKRPDCFLDLARRCPTLRFDLVGPDDGGPYAARVLSEARSLPNLTVHGAIAREKVYEFYRAVACLCSTSLFEGFPNTFLEAWSQGLPVVSTFDPDNLIARRHLGAVAPDVPGLALALRELLESPDRWSAASREARRYFVENHTVDAAMTRFEEVFVDAGRAAHDHR
jgi:glycosyltransferase involved in cell wall biosynthesis